MSVLKPPRKTVESPFNTSAKSNTKKQKPKTLVPITFKALDKRQFFHIQSNQRYAIQKSDDNDDSEDEFSSVLIRQLSQRAIDQNNSLNDGEKQLTNLWNKFVECQVVFGIKHMQNKCEMFIDAYASEICQQQLYQNFLLHLCNLYDVGLLQQKQCLLLVDRLHQRMGLETMRPEQLNEIHDRPKRKRKRTLSMDENSALPNQKQQRYGLRSTIKINHG